MPAELAEGEEQGREHPVAGQPLHPLSSSRERGTCPASFTGVQGTGGTHKLLRLSSKACALQMG